MQDWHGERREPAPYLVPMMEEILKAERTEVYLIYRDSMDDCATIEGYVIGEDAADRYIEEHNKGCRYEYEELTWERLDELSTEEGEG